MKAHIAIFVAGVVLLLVSSINAAQAGENSTGEATVQELLKGVVHLTDDDVRFRTPDGHIVFVDPVSWPTDDLVINSGFVKPDVILITHSHSDHFQPTIIQEYLNMNPNAIVVGPPDVARIAAEKKMNVREIIPGKSYTIAGISFTTVPAYFLEGDSHPRAKEWVGYVLHLDGTNYYITGDTQPLPGMANISVDVLFPLLSGCGGNMDQALSMSELSKPRLVVPVHTSGQEATIKKYIARLPKEVQGAYFKDGKLVFER